MAPSCKEHNGKHGGALWAPTEARESRCLLVCARPCQASHGEPFSGEGLLQRAPGWCWQAGSLECRHTPLSREAPQG